MLRSSLIRNKRVCRLTPLCRTAAAVPTLHHYKQRSSHPLRFGFLGCTAAAALIAASTEEEDVLPTEEEYKYLDQLYKENKFAELHQAIARFSTQTNAELLWRQARAEWELIKFEEKKKDEARVRVAHELANLAIAADDGNFNAHRWKGILSNAHAETLGIKAQINNLNTMRHHLERAVELNPDDATALTLLGIWYQELQELSWYTRKLASTFLGEVPETSYEQALYYFLEAERVAPRGWNRNLYLIAKVYFGMDDMKNTRKYLELVLSLPIVIEDDKEVELLAEALYKKMGILL